MMNCHGVVFVTKMLFFVALVVMEICTANDATGDLYRF